MKTLVIFIACILILFSGTLAGQLTKFQKWQQSSYFKGFNMSVWDNNDMREVNQQDFDSLKAIKANLVVIQTQGSMDVEPPYSPNIYYQEGNFTILYIEMLDKMVDFARNAGLMYVIAVRDGPGRIDVSEPGNSTIWINSTEQQLYGKMLKEIADRYLNDTLFVGLNMTVEPNPLGELWEPPISLLDSTLKANNIDINNLYTLWIDSIRTVDTELPLIVGGVHASHPEYFSLINKQVDNNIVYTTHLYNPGEFSHSDNPYSASYPSDYWCVRLNEVNYFDKNFLKDELYKPVRDFQDLYNVPVLVGEFGIGLPQNGGELYIEDIGGIACELGWHYAIWGFNNGPKFNYKDLDSIYETNYWSVVKSLMECGPTSIDEIPVSQKIIEIHPNPFSDFCIIRTENNADIEIFDSFGRSIIKAKGQLVWEPDFNVAEGAYFVSVRSNNKTQTKPIVFLK